MLGIRPIARLRVGLRVGVGVGVGVGGGGAGHLLPADPWRHCTGGTIGGDRSGAHTGRLCAPLHAEQLPDELARAHVRDGDALRNLVVLLVTFKKTTRRVEMKCGRYWRGKQAAGKRGRGKK